MHRMISCLGEPVLDYLPIVVTTIMAHCGIKDLSAFIGLLGQFMTRFRVTRSCSMIELTGANGKRDGRHFDGLNWKII